MSQVSGAISNVPLVGSIGPGLDKLGVEGLLKLGRGMWEGVEANKKQQPMTGGPQITVSPQPVIDPWGMIYGGSGRDMAFKYGRDDRPSFMGL